MPESAIASGEFEALLATWTSPDELDAVVGAKTTVKEADFPAARVSFAEMPVAA